MQVIFHQVPLTNGSTKTFSHCFDNIDNCTWFDLFEYIESVTSIPKRYLAFVSGTYRVEFFNLDEAPTSFRKFAQKYDDSFIWLYTKLMPNADQEMFARQKRLVTCAPSNYDKEQYIHRMYNYYKKLTRENSIKIKYLELFFQYKYLFNSQKLDQLYFDLSAIKYYASKHSNKQVATICDNMLSQLCVC
jgi:hypothetical protein